MSNLNMQTNVVYVDSKYDKAKTKSEKRNIPKTENTNLIPKNNSNTQFLKPINKVLGVLAGAKLTTLASANVYVQAALQVAKVVDKGVSTYLTFQKGYSGNYTASKNYNNFKTTIGAILSPLNAVISYEKVKMNTQVDHENKEQERILLGTNTRGV